MSKIIALLAFGGALLAVNALGQPLVIGVGLMAVVGAIAATVRIGRTPSQAPATEDAEVTA